MEVFLITLRRFTNNANLEYLKEIGADRRQKFSICLHSDMDTNGNAYIETSKKHKKGKIKLIEPQRYKCFEIILELRKGNLDIQTWVRIKKSESQNTAIKYVIVSLLRRNIALLFCEYKAAKETMPAENKFRDCQRVIDLIFLSDFARKNESFNKRKISNCSL